MREYVEIGDEKLQEFIRDWDKRFEEFTDESYVKMEELRVEHEEQMEVLNMKLDRAVEAVKIKPSAKLKEMQQNEKLVAVNERVEEAMNYRKELKSLEIKEAQRIEDLRAKNAENQRKKLEATQLKEIHQLKAKIETGKHNLQIQMDKALVVLQKEINLHVADIKRIQGLMATVALKKGAKADELRRIKDKSRKTQAFLSESKKVQSSTLKGAGESTSPERSLKQTLMSGATGSGTGPASQGSIIVDLLLFGQSAALKKGMSFSQSFSNTMSSTTGVPNQVYPLRYIVRHSPLTTFEISVTNSDGTRKTDTQMEISKELAKAGGKKKKDAPVS